MTRKIMAYILYRILGWRLEGDLMRDNPRILFVLLPHTSNWDFVFAWLFIKAEGLSVTIFAKDSFNFFPISVFYRVFGVVPIKRTGGNNFVDQAAALYDNGAHLWTAMAPEGTRSQTAVLRSGYYYFAKKAGIQLLLVGPNFSDKTFTVRPPRDIKPSFDEDAADLIEFSRRCKGKRPQLGI